MHRFRYMILATLLTTLGACAPMVIEYYKPSAPRGELVGPKSCARLVGPRTGIEFSDHGLLLQVVAHEKMINIRITVPEGKTATFLSNDIGLRTTVDGEPRTLNWPDIDYNHYHDVGGANRYEDIKIGPTDPMVGKTYNLSWVLKQPRLHSTSILLKEALPDTFYLQLPSLLYDGKTINYPQIQFKKAKGVGIYSVNC